jgi:hypothetical protein
MDFIRKTGLFDYLLIQVIDYKNIDLLGKDFLNICLLIYLCYFEAYYKEDKLKGLRKKGLLYHLPLFLVHFALYVDRAFEKTTTIGTLDIVFSYCLYKLIRRDLFK